jgi:hypothetical protein
MLVDLEHLVVALLLAGVVHQDLVVQEFIQVVVVAVAPMVVHHLLVVQEKVALEVHTAVQEVQVEAEQVTLLLAEQHLVVLAVLVAMAEAVAVAAVKVVQQVQAVLVLFMFTTKEK